MTRRRSLTILPLILAAGFALFQYFGAEKVTNPETGRSMRVAMSRDQEQALGIQSFREVLVREIFCCGRWSTKQSRFAFSDSRFICPPPP